MRECKEDKGFEKRLNWESLSWNLHCHLTLQWQTPTFERDLITSKNGFNSRY